MKRVLSIFDVSPFIHAGHINKRAFLEQFVERQVPGQPTLWCTQRTMAGGTAFLLKAAILAARRGEIVFCCDRNPTIKKSMLSTYKSNRTHPAEIEDDKKLAEFVLKNCGATVLSSDGYEADDIICTLTQSLHDSYDVINILTGDSDLYFLVDDIVSIKPSSSRAKEVTMDNFSQSIKKGLHIPYNCAIPYKMAYGDTSDCISALPQPVKDNFMRFAVNTEGISPLLGRKDVLEFIVDNMYPETRHSLDMIYPLEVKDLPAEFAMPDIQQMINWADTMHCGEYSGMSQKYFNADELIAQVQSMGLYVEE